MAPMTNALAACSPVYASVSGIAAPGNEARRARGAHAGTPRSLPLARATLIGCFGAYRGLRVSGVKPPRGGALVDNNRSAPELHKRALPRFGIASLWYILAHGTFRSSEVDRVN
eukprot:395531-Prorocentrum_minimum.AAC.2